MHYSGSLWYLAYYLLLQLTWPFVFIHLFKLASKTELKKLILFLLSGFVFLGLIWQFYASTESLVPLIVIISQLVPPTLLIVWSVRYVPKTKAKATIVTLTILFSLPALIGGSFAVCNYCF